MTKRYSGPSEAQILAGLFRRQGVEVNPVRLEDRVAAHRSREKANRNEAERHVAMLAGTLKRARRECELAEFQWRRKPSADNLTTARAAQARPECRGGRAARAVPERRAAVRRRAVSVRPPVNADQAVCEFTVVFDEPSEDGRPAELREDYEPFAAFAAGVLPVRVGHRRVLTSSGSYDVGRALRRSRSSKAAGRSRAAC